MKSTRSTLSAINKTTTSLRRPMINPFSTGSSVPPATISSKPVISHLDHIVLTVKDIDASVEFYVRVLGMRKEVFGPEDKPRVALCFGNSKINLQHELAKINPYAGEPTKGSADICLITQHSPEDILSFLSTLDKPDSFEHPFFRDHQAKDQVLTGYFSALKERGEGLMVPCIRTGAMGRIDSIYLRDPDGNLIEVSSYPSTPSVSSTS